MDQRQSNPGRCDELADQRTLETEVPLRVQPWLTVEKLYLSCETRRTMAHAKRLTDYKELGENYFSCVARRVDRQMVSHPEGPGNRQ